MSLPEVHVYEVTLDVRITTGALVHDAEAACAEVTALVQSLLRVHLDAAGAQKSTDLLQVDIHRTEANLA